MPPRAAATVRLPFRRRACGLRLVRNRARRAGVGRHRDPARRADPGHARGGRPGTSLGHGLSARWRHPHHRTPRQSAAAAHSRRPVRALERRTQGGRAGQGGLLDVALSPDFAKDRLVYLSYAEAGDGRAGTAWDAATWPMTGPAWRISASCSGRSPSCPRGCISVPAWSWTAKGIFTSRWARTTSAPPRKTWASCRERSCASGPTARCRRTIPCGQGRRAPEIWSYGHRNPQGMALNPWSGELWESEHGRGGDEVNLIKPGLNYGWPLATYGIDYSGQPIPRRAARRCRAWSRRCIGGRSRPPSAAWRSTTRPGFRPGVIRFHRRAGRA